MARDVPATKILLDWWQSKRGNRAMPARSELDPVELKAILPSLILIDVAARSGAAASHDFTYRLAGTEIDDRFGIKLTRMPLEQAPFGEARARIQEQYETAVAEVRPVFCSHNMTVAEERYVEYDRLAVPLSGDDPNRVTALAAAVDFRCAYLVDRGNRPACSGQSYCDRIDLCMASHARR